LCRDHGRVLADGGYRGVEELVTPVFERNRRSGGVIANVALA
jgi:hypothetical protein